MCQYRSYELGWNFLISPPPSPILGRSECLIVFQNLRLANISPPPLVSYVLIRELTIGHRGGCGHANAGQLGDYPNFPRIPSLAITWEIWQSTDLIATKFSHTPKKTTQGTFLLRRNIQFDAFYTLLMTWDKLMIETCLLLTVPLSWWSTSGVCKTSVCVCLPGRGACLRANNEKETMECNVSSKSNTQRLHNRYQVISIKSQTSSPLGNDPNFQPSFRCKWWNKINWNLSCQGTAAAHRDPIYVSRSSIGIFVLFPSNTSSARLSLLGEVSKPGSNISSITRHHLHGFSSS